MRTLGSKAPNPIIASPCMSTLRAHSASVRALNFAGGGASLISGDEDGWVVIWNLHIRRPTAIWRAHSHALLAVQSRGPHEALTHGRDNKIRIWSFKQPQEYVCRPLDDAAREIDYPKPWLVYSLDVNALNFCAVAVKQIDPNTIAVPSTAGSDKIDVYTISPLTRPLKAVTPFDGGSPNSVMSLIWIEDRLVAGYESGDIAVFDADGSLVTAEKVHNEPVMCLASDGKRVFSGAADRTLGVLSMDSVTVSKVKLSFKGISSLEFNVSRLMAAGWDSRVHVFDSSLEEIQTIPGDYTVVRASEVEAHPVMTRRIRPLPDAWMALGGKNGRIWLGEFENGSVPTLLDRRDA